MTRLLQSPYATALGWALLHSLWEGGAVAAALFIALFAVRSPRSRYAIAYAGMFAIVAGFVVTFLFCVPQELGMGAGIHGELPFASRGAFSSPGIFVPFDVARVLPWLVPFWIAGVILFQLRSAAGWVSLRRLQRRGVCYAPDEWRQRLERLSQRLRLTKPISLMETCMSDVPIVIGYLRPVILAPVGMLTAFPIGQMEAVLLHELAHIQRNDYLANLIQTAIESLMFYHPAIWWISGVVRAERENCCDDLAVSAVGDAHQYALALTALEEKRQAGNQLALAANGGSLVKRIRRLLLPQERSAGYLTPAFSAAVLGVTFVLTIAAWQSKPVQVKTPDFINVQTAWDQWLEQVAPIISAEERNAFLSLGTDAEREHFIEQFWQYRNPSHADVGNNEFKIEYYRRMRYVSTHYPSASGAISDRARIYLKYGPADEVESHPSGGKYTRPAQEGGGETNTSPFEQWLYRQIPGVGTNVIIEFVDAQGTGDYRMTKDPNGKYRN